VPDFSLASWRRKSQNKFMTVDIPRRHEARYASTMADEIQKNVGLASGEEVSYSLHVRERKNWLIAQPRLLSITPLRIILLEHNLFSADWILEIPRCAVKQVSHEETTLNAWVSFIYAEMGETRVVQLQPMLRSISPEANQELFGILNAFHLGQLKPPA
jgi:hypothetical protein